MGQRNAPPPSVRPSLTLSFSLSLARLTLSQPESDSLVSEEEEEEEEVEESEEELLALRRDGWALASAADGFSAGDASDRGGYTP